MGSEDVSVTARSPSGARWGKIATREPPDTLKAVWSILNSSGGGAIKRVSWEWTTQKWDVVRGEEEKRMTDLGHSKRACSFVQIWGQR